MASHEMSHGITFVPCEPKVYRTGFLRVSHGITYISWNIPCKSPWGMTQGIPWDLPWDPMKTSLRRPMGAQGMRSTYGTSRGNSHPSGSHRYSHRIFFGSHGKSHDKQKFRWDFPSEARCIPSECHGMSYLWELVGCTKHPRGIIMGTHGKYDWKSESHGRAMLRLSWVVQ